MRRMRLRKWVIRYQLDDESIKLVNVNAKGEQMAARMARDEIEKRNKVPIPAHPRHFRHIGPLPETRLRLFSVETWTL